MKLFIFLVAFVMLVGCASSPIDRIEAADTVPSARLYGFAKKSDAHLIILHDSSIAGVSCPIRVLIDGKPAADINVGEVAHFGITIGSHSLTALPLEGCPKFPMQKINIAVKAGDALIKRIDTAGINSFEL
ncbi:hypothetical protein ACDZ94_26880 (plasmid) [Pseudomonas sp. UBT]|uniref:hypothetical protein n=1 Tax=Pseudomonas sp. UBT TaxID=3239198 RepID=UPI003D805829